MDIGLLAAFAGGALALLSPCAALLLPAFFASSVGARGRLIVHGVVFYVGLMITLLPVGIGVGALAALVADHRSQIITGASVLIVLLGVLQIFGRGFDLTRLMPGMSRIQAESMQRSGLAKTLLLGAVSGVAGFCTGPILGAVLTMAASRGMGGAGLLLAAYGMGMVVPLMAIAAIWNRLGDDGRSRLRGRELSVGRVRVHTTHLVTGLLLIVVGIGFWLTDGFLGVPEPVGLDTQQWLQNGASMLASPVLDVVVIVALAVILLGWWWRRRSRAVSADVPRSRPQPSESPRRAR
ncbi:cytochrome c biogenesis CcdA family protein [Gordonia tangerina]|uniref:Cytochrome c biogenesis CcdA family protein n=1 Tax=Gordonia tangerina TaxID=2911060 RepID=A0ABS9DMS0_9ACTN|nr:cytochrome c biogenesis CcdA family protein [Gordonia tangerina]MCF3940534.1 cytochrome c biogenesis CcdA family protein [Gordonia tangerina]